MQYPFLQAMSLPNHPYRYAQQLGNHPKVTGALAKAKARQHWQYTAADFLRRLVYALPDGPYRKSFFDAIQEGDLQHLLEHPPRSLTPLGVLPALQLLPTPSILKFVEDKGKEEIRHGLEERIRAIADGGFQLSDPLLMELEYSRLCLSKLPEELASWRRMSLDAFRKLPWIEGKELHLDADHYHYADLTAKEAATVFNLIVRKQEESDIPVLVIANMRYGSYFVIAPLEDRLAERGIKVVHEYARSIDFDNKTSPFSLSRGTWIIEHHPNIFVIDGTRQSTKDDCTRFPAAMWGYVHAFVAYNAACDHEVTYAAVSVDLRDYLRARKPSLPYKIRFWAPERTNDFFIGRKRYVQHPEKDEPREVTIASASLEKHGSAAWFDDPESEVKGNRCVGFTSHGLSWMPIAKSTEDFVAAIQGIIKERIAAYLP